MLLLSLWEGSKSQAASLGSIILGRAKCVLGCSFKTLNEAVWRDMGLEVLQVRCHSDFAKITCSPG